MPPTTAARWMIRSGRTSFSRRMMSDSFRRSYSRLLGLIGAEHPRSTSAFVTKEPRNPAPPVTTTRLSVQKPPISLRAAEPAVSLEIGIDHHPDQLGETNLGRPAERSLRFARVT